MTRRADAPRARADFLNAEGALVVVRETPPAPPPARGQPALVSGNPAEGDEILLAVWDDGSITTLEGLGSKTDWHPVQQAFEDAQAAQCGYCLNGMVMQAAALLARERRPSEARIRAELSGNLCRCGTHVEILRAVALAAQRIADREDAA